MTTIESREIRGITLRILYLLVAFAVVSTAGILTSYFGLKNDNLVLTTQIEILKIQYKTIDQRLEKIENKNETSKQHAYIINQKPDTAHNFMLAAAGLQNKAGTNQ